MTCYVYVIGPDGGPYKIGFATNLRSRLQGLQTGNHLPLACHFAARDDCAPGTERKLHERFAASRLSGEWFSADLDHIREAFVSLGLTVTDYPIGLPSGPEFGPISDEDVETLLTGKATPELFERWRKSQGLNRSKASEALGVSRNMPERYETGKAVIPVYVALACAALSLGLKPWPN